MEIKKYNPVVVRYQANKSALATINDKYSFVLDPTLTKGPAPGQVLLASLGGCEMAAFAFYSKKQYGLELESMEIILLGWRVQDPEDGYLGIREIDIEYRIKCNKSEQETKEIVDKLHNYCPVGQSLSNKIKITYKTTVL